MELSHENETALHNKKIMTVKCLNLERKNYYSNTTYL